MLCMVPIGCEGLKEAVPAHKQSRKWFGFDERGTLALAQYAEAPKMGSDLAGLVAAPGVNRIGKHLCSFFSRPFARVCPVAYLHFEGVCVVAVAHDDVRLDIADHQSGTVDLEGGRCGFQWRLWAVPRRLRTCLVSNSVRRQLCRSYLDGLRSGSPISATTRLIAARTTEEFSS